jgi:Ni/Co efflux regulator RcnB
MKKFNPIGFVLAAVLCLSQAAAWAQPGRGNGRDCNPGVRNCERSRGPVGNENRYNKQRFDNGHDNRPDMRGQNDARGAGPSRDFYRGQRLPSYYRGSQYVVDDWRGHGLRTPPRGYHWVQTGGDYVLVAIATGVILELMLSR